MLFILLISICLAQTFDDQTQCVNDLEVCQTQVTILTNSLSQTENIASQGPFKACDPANVSLMNAWWAEKLSAITDYDLFVCMEDTPYWVVQMKDGSYRSTCVAFSSDLEGACPSDDIYCSLILEELPVYGYAGNVLAALQEALASTTKAHPFCPKGACAPINDWLRGEMELEGIASEDTAKICLYGDEGLDQYYYIVDGNTIQNTCIVEGSSWQDECVADASRVCSGISSDGVNIVGWPRQQARMLVKAMTNADRAHPQCLTA